MADEVTHAEIITGKDFAYYIPRRRRLMEASPELNGKIQTKALQAQATPPAGKSIIQSFSGRDYAVELSLNKREQARSDSFL